MIGHLGIASLCLALWGSLIRDQKQLPRARRYAAYGAGHLGVAPAFYFNPAPGLELVAVIVTAWMLAAGCALFVAPLIRTRYRYVPWLIATLGLGFYLKGILANV